MASVVDGRRSVAGEVKKKTTKKGVKTPPKTQTRTNERTNEQTKGQTHFSLKIDIWWQIILMIFLVINSPNLVYLLVDPGFYPFLNFYEASLFVPHRMGAPDRHNGQGDLSVRSSLRWSFTLTAHTQVQFGLATYGHRQLCVTG